MQQSIMFHAYVEAIGDSLNQAILELRATFGDSLTIEEVIETIGKRELMRKAMSGGLFYREVCQNGEVNLRSNIPQLYRKALDEEIIQSIWGYRL